MKKTALRTLALAAACALATSVQADQVIADDLIVQGDTCVGFDCVNNEVFNGNNLVLKENNTRFVFRPTDGSNAWELTANESASGGLNHFSLLDIDGTSWILRVMAGAPSHALVIAAPGLGLGTPDPLARLHVVDPDTPRLRLEQTGGVAQVWDLAASHLAFAVRDSTGGDLAPLRVAAGAPSNAFVVGRGGRIGIGTVAPASPLHVYSSDGNAQLRVEATDAVSAERVLVDLRNEGPVQLAMTSGGQRWVTSASATTLSLTRNGTERMRLDGAGNLTLAGTLSQGSSRTMKTDIEPMDDEQVLVALAQVDVHGWRYRDDPVGARHIGPMAESFHDALAVGSDPARLAPGDLAAAALAAIQALSREIAAKDTAIAELSHSLDVLERLLGAKEATR